MRRIAAAFASGTAGTVLLNATTYLDMALRGRPASSLPGAAVAQVAGDAGISLGHDEESASAREVGLGA